MASDRVLVDTSRSANFARRAFTTAVFCSLPAAAVAALPRMAAKANMMLVNFIFRLKRDWGDLMGGKRWKGSLFRLKVVDACRR